MKKIQVSTVRQTADVEVIFMNTTFVAKVLNAANTLRHVTEDMSVCANCCGEDEGIKAYLEDLEKVDTLFTELEIAFGIKEEAKPVESKEDPFNANVPAE